MASDDPPDHFEDEPTHQDSTVLPEKSGPVSANERNTGTYSGSAEFVAGREAGYEAGFKAGVDKALTALRVELMRAGATSDEIARVAARIKSVANSSR
ncbi:MAG TPA: hypothetical protein VN903_33345 [Polyangia bacterium]|jgi:hypothetical protein|nr:hypothetical protein [Polyangia bacterium]